MDARVRVVVKIIEEKKGAIHPSLRQSCRLLGITQDHLLRLFKRDVGMTFCQYLRKRRMSQAAKLLCDLSMPIKRIAPVFGYSDVSNFYRDFKEIHGMSPRKFRACWLTLMPQPVELRTGRPNIPGGSL